MSIETEFESTITNVKNAYQGLDNLGATIPENKTIENIKSCLDEIYAKFPKTEYAEGTEITLSNTLKGKLDYDDGVVGIGQTEQETTTGINLLNYITNLKTNFEGLMSQINDDGSITTTGTPAYNYVGIIDMNITSMLEIGQSYTISQKTASSYLYLQINATNTQTSQSTFYFLVNETSKTFTVQANTTYILRLQTPTRAVWGTDSRTLTNFYQLEKSSTAHTFEKCSGGYASPSPNWEQEVKCVAGRNKLKVDFEAVSVNGIDFSSSEEEITITGTTTASANTIVGQITLPKGSYTLSCTNMAYAWGTSRIEVSGTGIDTLSFFSGTLVRQLTLSQETALTFRAIVSGVGTSVNYKTKIQVEEGSEAHKWLPYNTIEEVVSGKNILPFKFNSNTINGITLTANDDGTIKINGTSTANTSLGGTVLATFTLKKGTYTYSIENSLISGANISIWYDNATVYKTLGTTTSLDFELTEDTTFARFRLSLYIPSGQTYNNLVLKPMLRKSSITDDTYEPYITPTSYQLSLGDIELNAIGNYKDELIYDVDEDKVYKNEKIKKVVYTGASSEDWNTSGLSVEGYKGYYINNSDKIQFNDSPILANYFIQRPYQDWSDLVKANFIETSTSTIGVRIEENLASNLSNFRNWLASHNLVVLYELKQTSHTKVEITGTLKAQVKAWYNAHSNNGTTIITSNGNLPMIIKCRGLKGE